MTLSFVGGVAGDILRAPVHVRVSLVPELFDGDTTDDDDDIEYNKGGRYTVARAAEPYAAEPYADDDPRWPSDRVWAEAERMLNVTTIVCAMSLSAAWCLLLLTVFGGVLGLRNILSGY